MLYEYNQNDSINQQCCRGTGFGFEVLRRGTQKYQNRYGRKVRRVSSKEEASNLVYQSFINTLTIGYCRRYHTDLYVDTYSVTRITRLDYYQMISLVCPFVYSVWTHWTCTLSYTCQCPWVSSSLNGSGPSGPLRRNSSTVERTRDILFI